MELPAYGMLKLTARLITPTPEKKKTDAQGWPGDPDMLKRLWYNRSSFGVWCPTAYGVMIASEQ